MAEELKITTEADEKQALAAQIDELELLFQKSENTRKKQFLISVCALLSMIIILTVAILNLMTYFRNYPKKLLMREVFLQARPMLYSPWNIRGSNPRERRILQQTVAELDKSLRAYMPQIRFALRESVRSLKRYTFTSLRRKFEDNLYIDLQRRTRKYINDQQFTPSPAAIRNIRDLNKALAQEITNKVFSALVKAMNSSGRFREEVDLLYRSGQMASLAEEPRILLEERFLHSLLKILPDSSYSGTALNIPEPHRTGNSVPGNKQEEVQP